MLDLLGKKEEGQNTAQATIVGKKAAEKEGINYWHQHLYQHTGVKQ